MLLAIISDIKKILYEAYNPKLICKKICSVPLMRIKKLLAVFINEKFGYIFLGWNGIENKLLDILQCKIMGNRVNLNQNPFNLYSK